MKHELVFKEFVPLEFKITLDHYSQVEHLIAMLEVGLSDLALSEDTYQHLLKTGNKFLGLRDDLYSYLDALGLSDEICKLRNKHSVFTKSNSHSCDVNLDDINSVYGEFKPEVDDIKPVSKEVIYSDDDTEIEEVIVDPT